MKLVATLSIVSALIGSFTTGPAGAQTLKKIRIGYPSLSFRQSNVWVAKGGHARQITPYTLDDGFDIGDLACSADESWVAYVRGGSIEDDLPANVNNSPEGAAPKEVWVISTSGGTPRKGLPLLVR